MYRTKTCGELNINNAGEKVELAGWIQKKRNLGGMEFIDLRDEFGITQIIINDEKLQEQAKEFTTESCIHVEGKVVERSNKNKNIKTGEIEVNNVSLANDEQKSEFLCGILYYDFTKFNGNKNAFEKKYNVTLPSSGSGLIERLKGKKITEYLGVYYQNDNEDVPDVNKTEKRIITYKIENR